jgi:hypothetical protein
MSLNHFISSSGYCNHFPPSASKPADWRNGGRFETDQKWEEDQVYNWIAILRIIVYRWALLKWRMTHRKKGGGLLLRLQSVEAGQTGPGYYILEEEENGTEWGDSENWKVPRLCEPTEARRETEEGVGGGHRSPPLLIRQRRFMWTATGCRANERTGPIHLGSLPLVFPPLFFLFFFLLSIPITRTQWRGQSWVRTPYGLFFLFFLRSSSLPSRRWNISALGVSNI